MSNLVSDMIDSFDSSPEMSPKKIGLFFGSFNPIHIGHLIIADYMLSYTDNDEIWFVVSPHNPLKSKSSLLEDYHRLALVKEAIDDRPGFRASDIEFSLDQPSYTVKTLAFLKEKYPNYVFSLIMGEDNLRTLHKWKNFEVILEQNPIYVYPRVLTIQELEKLNQSKNIDKNGFENHPNVTITDSPVMKISSSQIRQMIKEGKSIRYLVTPSVAKYIDEMNFYR